VQNSVVNALHETSKTQPGWLRQVCQRWLEESPVAATRSITTRALRTLATAQNTQPTTGERVWRLVPMIFGQKWPQPAWNVRKQLSNE